MALKAVLTAEEHGELPVEVQAHYTEAQDGKFRLDVEGKTLSVERLETTLQRWKDAAGFSDPRKLETRLQEAERIRDSFGDLDPDETRAALDRLRELEDGEGDEDRAAELKRVREAAEEKYRKEWEPKVTSLTEERDRYREGMERLTIHRDLSDVLASTDEHGQPVILPGEEMREAVKTLLLQKYPHRVVWEEDKPKGVFVTELGEEVEAKTFAETWLRSDGAKAFRPASGNNGSGSRETDRGGSGVKNPWKSETYNLTEQGKIMKENPALAKQLAAAAGKKLQVA